MAVYKDALQKLDTDQVDGLVLALLPPYRRRHHRHVVRVPCAGDAP